MGRTKGAKNKLNELPGYYTLTPEQWLQMIADLLIEIICEEAACDRM